MPVDRLFLANRLRVTSTLLAELDIIGPAQSLGVEVWTEEDRDRDGFSLTLDGPDTDPRPSLPRTITSGDLYAVEAVSDALYDLAHTIKARRSAR